MASIIETFRLAQTFYIDKSSVKNASTVGLTAVDLFFKNKPSISSSNGTVDMPGVHIFLCEVFDNDIPNINRILEYSNKSLDYDEIFIDATAQQATTFTFERPIIVETDKSYAIIVKYEGENNSYKLWSSVEGDKLVGTVDKVAGPSGQYVGKYYDYVKSSNNTTTSWKPLNTTDLKFNVYCARYEFDEEITSPVFQGKTSYVLPKKNYEFLTFDKRYSSNTNNTLGGEYVYQNSVVQPYTISVRNDSDIVTTTNGNFNLVYSGTSTDDQYIIIFSGNNKNIRRVEQILSEKELVIDEYPTFSNTAAEFSKAPVGVISYVSDTIMFGKNESFLVIDDSNANASLRFTNNTIENITINNGGSGYSNTDFIIIYNGANTTSNSELNATANITTNSTGGIINTRLSNTGTGFFNLNPSFIVKTVSNSTSSGTNANLSFKIGSTLYTELSNAKFSNATLINIGVNGLTAGALDFDNPAGTQYDIKLNNLYFNAGDSIVDIAIANGGSSYSNNERFVVTGSPSGSGAFGYIRTDSTGKIVDAIMQSGGNNYTGTANVVVDTVSGLNAVLEPIVGSYRASYTKKNEYTDRYISLLRRHNLPFTELPQILSRSYEVTQPTVQYTTQTNKTINTNISSLVEMILISNNEYTSPEVLDGKLDINYEKYSINNSYKNEHIGLGEAASKHISDKINFTDDRIAEDLRVFMRAYRPLGTDIKVYARIHNSSDSEAFDDKDWTLLEYKVNGNIYSQLGNESDFIEYTFGFTQYPNTEFTAAGYVTTTLDSATVTGSNTNFQNGTNSLSVNDLIKIYSPLFPENYLVATVNSITSNTSLTINSAVSNNNVVGSGLLLDKLEYPNQAFNNILNGNVVRYYNSQLNEFDGYSTFSIKIVFLSSTTGVVPKIDDTRGVGVTA